MDSKSDFFFFLPIPVVQKIIKYIKDNDSYLNLRLTCKNIYFIMPEVKSFYLNGLLKSSIKFFLGKPIGSYTVYTKDGYLKKTVPLNENDIDGIVRFYHHFKAYYKCCYVNGKKDGFEVFNYYNGQIFLETFYRSNLKHGRETMYFQNGLIYSKKNYYNGLLHGVTTFYKEIGHISLASQFNKNMLNGETILYYENGTPFVICNFKNNVITGEYKVFYNNGNLKMSYNIKNSFIHGIVKQWHSNGKLKTIVKFKKGKKNGIQKSWYRNGVACIIENYNNGVLHGTKVFYDYDTSNSKYVIYHFKYNMGKLLKFSEVKDRQNTTLVNYIYDENKNLIGGKFNNFSANVEIETDFDKNMNVSGFIHQINLNNNSYYKFYKINRSTIIKKFSEKNFVYSISKIDNQYKIFDNTVEDKPRKYFTTNLGLIHV